MLQGAKKKKRKKRVCKVNTSRVVVSFIYGFYQALPFASYTMQFEIVCHEHKVPKINVQESDIQILSE